MDTEKPAIIVDKSGDLELRIQQLEELWKNFATGIVNAPTIENGTTKGGGIHSSVSNMNGQTQVKSRMMSVNTTSKLQAPSVVSQGDANISRVIDTNNTANNVASSATAVPLVGIVGEEKSTLEARVREVYHYWDETAKEYVDKDVLPQSKVKKPETRTERAFTYRKIFNRGGTAISSEIEIEDDVLNNNIKTMVSQTYPSGYYKTWPTVPWKIGFPFNMIVHSYDKLERFSAPDGKDKDKEKIENEDEKIGKEDVRRLLEYVKNTSELTEYFRVRKERPNTIAFRYLWTLFPPGIEVLARPFFNQWQLFRTDNEPDTISEDLDSQPRPWAVKPWCFDWTGTDWVKSEFEFEIEPYEREKEISELPCFPLKYFEDAGKTAEELRSELLKVGEDFKAYCELEGAARMIDYDDLAIAVGKTNTGTLFSVTLHAILSPPLLITTQSDQMSFRSTSTAGENVKRPKVGQFK
jgi:hypothetical protein